MDEEMEDNAIEYTFTVVEIDLDYEFDAVRYFDFSREESLAEARQAELWFDTAASYPPSPFVAKLIPFGGYLMQNVNTSPKSKHRENVNLTDDESDIDVDGDVSDMDRDDDRKELNCRETSANLQSSNIQKFKNRYHQLTSVLAGLKFYSDVMKDSSKAKNKSKTKSSMKPSLSRTSTLMKPTASQLAKQNQPCQTGDTRFRKLLVDKNEKNLSNSCGIEIQAAKRQKLEGGCLCKVAETKPQTNFVHKLPKTDGNIEGKIVPAKLRLTIPREPDLETSHRAQKIRSKTSRETENLTTARRFKALPLNRKILEGPSLLPKRSTPRLPEFQEFHLQTSQRAMQHIAAVSTSSVSCSNLNKELNKSSSFSDALRKNGSRSRPYDLDTSKHEGSELSHNFKALPLNKKIFSSKGDIGVFRNIKRDITVPVEFNFHTDKRVLHNPPTELFKKLSLTSEPQPIAASRLEMQQTSFLPMKGSKENRWHSSQHENEVKLVKEKPFWNSGKQIPLGCNGRNTDVGSASGTSRSLGIR